jgi:hypothetical protein
VIKWTKLLKKYDVLDAVFHGFPEHPNRRTDALVAGLRTGQPRKLKTQGIIPIIRRRTEVKSSGGDYHGRPMADDFFNFVLKFIKYFMNLRYEKSINPLTNIPEVIY